MVTIAELNANVKVHMEVVDDNSRHPKQMQESICIVGPPGTAKTANATTVFRQLWADRHDCDLDEVALIVCRCAGRDAAEFIGMGIPQKETELERYEGEISTRNSIPDLLIQIERARQGMHDSTDGKKAKAILLVLDEALQADIAVQKTLSSLYYRNENTLGGFDAGPNVCVVITGNRQGDKAGASGMLSMNRDRVMYYEMEGYTVAALQGYEKFLQSKDVLPIFTQYVMENLETAPWDSDMEKDRSHMTFRSFFMVTQTLQTFWKMNNTTELTFAMQKAMAARLGTRGANSIADFIRLKQEGVPTADEIMADPEGASVPDDTGAQASAGGVALFAVIDSATAEAALCYISRLRKDLRVSLFAQVLHASTKGGFILNSDRASKFIGTNSRLITILESLQG
jgi:hypothetical protein